MVSRGSGFAAGILAVALLAAGCGGKGGGNSSAYPELSDSDPQVRLDAVVRLGSARAEDAVDPLIACLDDPDESVRVEVVRALGAIGDPRVVPDIARMVDDPSHAVRLAVTKALSDMADPRSIDALAKLLYDPSETVRVASARALGNIPGQKSLDVLLKVALQDDSEWVRQHVVRVVGKRKVKEAIPRVEESLSGESDRVRANAAWVLGELGDRSSRPALISALEDPYYKVRSLAAHSLSHLAPDDPEVKAALLRTLDGETNQLVRVDLAWALARMGDRSRLSVPRTLLFQGRPEEVRAEAAKALGDVGDKSDVEILARATHDKKGLVAREAYLAYKKLTGEKE